MASLIEFIIVLLVSLGMNLIPFAGPSNLLILNMACTLSWQTPMSLHLCYCGFLIALGAALSQRHTLHGNILYKWTPKPKKKTAINADANKIKKWAFPLLFVVAASPLPDEPIVIPLGLMKYSPPNSF